MKPIIEVSLLPWSLSQQRLRDIQQAVVKAVESVEELGLKGEESILVLLPKDMMEYGLGKEIPVEGRGFPGGGEICDSAWTKLALALHKTLQDFFPGAYVQCTVGSNTVPVIKSWCSEFVGDRRRTEISDSMS